MSINNPYLDRAYGRWGYSQDVSHAAFNEGVKAAVQYLEEKCDKTSHYMYSENIGTRRRKDCPDCMKQIHEELGI